MGAGAGNGNVHKDEKPIYDGPERRRSSEGERNAWRRRHSPREREGRTWYAYLWKSLTVLFSAGLVSALTWGAQRWIDRVEAHIVMSVTGYERLAAVEREVNVLAAEFREARRDALEERIWAARRAGDREAARYFEGRLRRLESGTGAKD